MKVKFFTLLSLGLCFFLWSCQEQPAKTPTPKAKEKKPDTIEALTLTNSITQQEIADGWKLLFDGRSFEHWRGYNKESVPATGWKAENGEMMVHGGGDLITKEKYENFDLTLEFSLSEAANSGIFYMAQEIPDKPIYISSPEYQLLDNETYINTQGMEIMNKHLTGDNYDLQDGVINPHIGKNKWYKARILVNKGHVEHWLNGKKCIEYEWNSPEWKEMIANSKFKDWPYGKEINGHIGLQDHGNEVKFRNIKIRRL